MLAAGLSLSRALSVIERQSSNKRLKAIAAQMSESIRKGSSFHEALSAHPKVFSGLMVAMARAGEESGSLACVLDYSQALHAYLFCQNGFNMPLVRAL